MLVLSQKTAYTTQLDAAQKRLGAGFGTCTDIDEARAALDLNVAQELEARQNPDFTRRQLQSLVNRPIDRLAPLDSSKMRLVPPAPDRVEDWVERAEINSPELQSHGAQLEAAKYELEKAQAGHYPTLDAIAQLSRNDSDTVSNIKTRYTNKSIGLQLNIPLYSCGHVSSTVRQALAGQQRAEEALEALRRDIWVRLHREFRGVTEGVLRVKALEQAVRSAEQVVISNRRSFDAGSRTLPDVLNAEHQKVSAQRDLAQARFIYLMSRIRLQALSGGAKAEVIDEITAGSRADGARAASRPSNAACSSCRGLTSLVLKRSIDLSPTSTGARYEGIFSRGMCRHLHIRSRLRNAAQRFVLGAGKRVSHAAVDRCGGRMRHALSTLLPDVMGWHDFARMLGPRRSQHSCPLS